MSNQRLTLAIGLLILLTLVILFFPRGGAGDGSNANPAPRELRAATSTKPAADSPRHRPDTQAASRQREPLAEHQVEDLPQFILPLVEGHEVSLKKAVNVLMEAYKDACYRSRTQPLALEFSLPDDAEARISFSIERGNFQAALAHLAALAGYTTRTDGLNVTFEPITDSPELYTRTFRVQPGLQATLKNQLQRLGLPHDAPLAEMAATAGLVSPGRSLALNSSGLLVVVTPLEHDKLETWLATVPAATQIKASVKLIHAEKPLEIDPRQATPDEVREWLGTLANQPGTSVVTAPSVVMRELQESTVEITEGPPTDWTGSRVTLEAERAGLAILTRDTTEYRPEDRATPPVRNTNQSALRDGDPQISVVSSREGAHLYRILTLELIDATGRTVREQEAGSYPVASALPDKPGFVLSPFNNQIIDVRGLGSGTLVRDPTYPAEERKFFRIP